MTLTIIVFLLVYIAMGFGNVIEQAAAYGVKISFGEFAKSGGIVAALCMILAAIWIVLVL